MNKKTSTLFIELIYILVNESMYFNYDFDFIFFIKVHDTIVNWWSETLGGLDKHQDYDGNFAQNFRNNEVVSIYLISYLEIYNFIKTVISKL